MSASDGELSPAPEPTTDPEPDRAPGGPADAFDPDTFPGTGEDVDTDADPAPATPDQPRSAQVEEHHVPDEIDSPEDVEGGDQSGDDGADGSSDEAGAGGAGDDREVVAEDVDDDDAAGEPAG